MSNAIKNAILKTKIGDALYDVFVKTGADNVYVDNTTTLAAKLTEIITDLGSKATTADVESAVNTAVNNLVNGAPESLNTLKEIVDVMATNDSVTGAINAAIGNKADKSVVTALQTKLDNIADGAQVNVIETVRVNGTALTPDENKAIDITTFDPDNKNVLSGITADNITNWNSKSRIVFSETQPDTMADGDMWVQLITE